MRLALGVLGGIASYFGERPLDVRLFDADPDFLNLSLRIGQSLLLIAQSVNRIAAYPELEIALEATHRVIYMAEPSPIARNPLATDLRTVDLFESIPPEVKILNLVEVESGNLSDSQTLLSWPKPMEGPSQLTFAFQILRWANGEEYPLEFLKNEDARPFHRWLDNPNALEL